MITLQSGNWIGECDGDAAFQSTLVSALFVRQGFTSAALKAGKIAKVKSDGETIAHIAPKAEIQTWISLALVSLNERPTMTAESYSRSNRNFAATAGQFTDYLAPRLRPAKISSGTFYGAPQLTSVFSSIF